MTRHLMKKVSFNKNTVNSTNRLKQKDLPTLTEKVEYTRRMVHWNYEENSLQTPRGGGLRPTPWNLTRMIFSCRLYYETLKTSFSKTGVITLPTNSLWSVTLYSFGFIHHTVLMYFSGLPLIGSIVDCRSEPPEHSLVRTPTITRGREIRRLIP